MLVSAAPKDATPPNSAEKNLANRHKTAKFAKVFSFESFPLYGNQSLRISTLEVFYCMWFNETRKLQLEPNSGLALTTNYNHLQKCIRTED